MSIPLKLKSEDLVYRKPAPDVSPQPDWSREEITKFWQPGQKLLRSIRRYQAAKARGAWLTSKYWVIVHKFWSTVSQCELHLNCNIGGGLLMPHPNGIVVHPHATLGVNCLILQQTTLAGAVDVGNHVDFGAGAKVIGPLSIGNNVTIGANAVVTKDLPSDVTAAGVPAQIIRHKDQDTHQMDSHQSSDPAAPSAPDFRKLG